MATGTLTIDFAALTANWRALDALTDAETAAVVKADGYGLGAADVARRLRREGARIFFVAVASEGAAVRAAVGPEPAIYVFSGHMAGDTDILRAHKLVPMLNSVDQMVRHVEGLPGHPFGIQLNTGMNRLGMDAAEWDAVREIALSQTPVLIMSHLACADEPGHPMNARQLAQFKVMTDGVAVPRSLAATGGILLGPEYHFDLTRPGVGLYGGMPFTAAQTVVQLDVPVIQTRAVDPGATVGYGNAWTAQRPSVIATISAGYADGLIRAMGPRALVWAKDKPCAVVGRVSMDLITVDVTDLAVVPESLSILNARQGVDDVAQAAGTIGYEILTSLGARYKRVALG